MKTEISFKTTILGSVHKFNTRCLPPGAEKITMLVPGEPHRGDHSIIGGPPLKRPSPLLPPSELHSERALGAGP